MLELTLKLLEHLGTLFKMRDTANHAAFAGHVEPIYRDIKTVHDDYTAAFKATRTSLRDEGVPLDSIIKQLKAKRETNERLRQELVSYSNMLHESRDFSDDFSTFCDHTSSIILAEPTSVWVHLGPNISQMGPIIKLLESWSYYESGKGFPKPWTSEKHFREYAASRLDATMANMDQNWRLVMKSYFALRVKYLKSAS